MTYQIRDSKGIMKATMSDKMASKIINTNQGHFRECRYPSCVGGVGYVIDIPVKFEIHDMNFYFWEGDILYKSAVCWSFG